VVGTDHVFVTEGGAEVRAGDLPRGARLESGWSYPAGYQVPDAEEYSGDVRGRAWETPVVVQSSEAAGRGPVFGASVSGTKSYFLTFGARCRAQV
jgi:hypothetical protein